MACSAGFPLVHVIHAGLEFAGFIREDFGVAIFAGVRLGVEGVAECGGSNALDVVTDLSRFHTLMTTIAVGGYRKCAFSIVAGATGTSFFHFRHGHGFFLAGYDFTIVTTFAFPAGLGDVRGVAEYRLSQSFDIIGHVARFALVAANAVLFCCHAEGFYTAVAGSAGFGLFHLRHGVTSGDSQIEDGVMTHSAVVSVLGKVCFVAEDDRFGAFKRVTDVLGFGSTCTDGSQQKQQAKK